MCTPAARRPATYREIPPPPELADLIECFWTIRSSAPLAGTRLNRVVPDGCSDIIFNFGDPPLRNGVPHHLLRSYVVGAMRRPLVVRMTDRIDLLGVRFRPGGALPFVGVPGDELTDRAVALDDVWSHAADEAAERVWEADAESRPAALARVLRERLSERRRRHPAVGRALELIAETHGGIRVRALHDAVGLSRRHLERLFAREVGLTPKMACRVTRFRTARALLLSDPGRSASRIAFACGYTDQSHLTREFRELAGITPVAYRHEQADVASVQDGGGRRG